MVEILDSLLLADMHCGLVTPHLTTNVCCLKKNHIALEGVVVRILPGADIQCRMSVSGTNASHEAPRHKSLLQLFSQEHFMKINSKGPW